MPQQSFEGFDVSVEAAKGKLEQKFIIPPFSVLDSRQGYWTKRRITWMELGIESEVGRGENLPQFSKTAQLNRKRHLLYKSHSGGDPQYYDKKAEAEAKVGKTLSNQEFEAEHYDPASGRYSSGTSIFDPVLCELMYKWFCPQGGRILDPFAGGSVRGIVASVLGYEYHGIDLSKEQIEANQEQADKICSNGVKPTWYLGDSLKLDSILPQNWWVDFILSCPPYHDLEQYSDNPDDLSNKSWECFKDLYREIIRKSILKLNYNRFACFVVSEIRFKDRDGNYKGFVPFTIDCFANQGARFYNDIILVNSVGSLPIRVVRQFGTNRKVGRTHQNILVFYKGAAEDIPRYFKDISSQIGEFASNT